jgi:dTDP-4-amino-4,6-dideoxygalactose transaminase
MLSPLEAENKWRMAFTFGSVYGVPEAQAMLEVLNSGAPSNGRRVAEFEEKFAAHEGGKHAIAASSWVGAAHLVAIAMDLEPGDEVIIPALTFQASANIFMREGAKIVFADGDPRTFNIDPGKIEERITPRTRAIVVVHMCGQMCEMDPIVEIARRHKLFVIQDAAHAPGAEYHGKRPGEFGDFVIYSFQATKNMGTLGEGGMVVTNHGEMAEKMRMLRAHGQERYVGINARMTDMQGAVGAIQLQRVDGFNDTRREQAYYLGGLLADVDGITPPHETANIKHVYHLYNTLVDEKAVGMTRDDFCEALWEKEEVFTVKQYWPTVNCLPVFRDMGHGEGECPVSEDVASRVVTLGIGPRLTLADMDELVAKIKRALNR